MDAIVSAIQRGDINNANISFDIIRNTAGRKTGLWRTLGRGRAILSSIEQLDEYLHSYGPMTSRQWRRLLPSVKLPLGQMRIVDYGCGQGLAGSLVLDHFGKDLARRIGSVVLTEPSQLALIRAEAILKCYCNGSAINVINKKLDDLTADDLDANGATSTLHLFSNVLDINGFEYSGLADKMFEHEGQHLILAVSHDRDFDGGSERFHGFDNFVRDSKKLTVRESLIDRFKLPNGQPAIFLKLMVEA